LIRACGRIASRSDACLNPADGAWNTAVGVRRSAPGAFAPMAAWHAPFGQTTMDFTACLEIEPWDRNEQAFPVAQK
jgi:hypothetical protein